MTAQLLSLAAVLFAFDLPTADSTIASDVGNFGGRVDRAATPVPVPEFLMVDIRSRELAPGEPARVVVRSGECLVKVEGAFLGTPLFFASQDESSGRVWSAWAAVDLDQKPGAGSLEVHVESESGVEESKKLEFAIRKKKFPEQRLTVAEDYVTPPPAIEARIAQEKQRLDGIYETRRGAPPPAGPFGRPVPGAPTGVFGTRRFFNGKPRSPHPGLDLKAATGTVVSASGPGIVVLASDLYFTGNTIIVDHGGGLFTIYAHLSRIDASEGATIDRGEPIGLSGATGRVTGPHLHWGAKIGSRPFDPAALLSRDLFR